MNDELQRIVDSLNAWGWSANARISFNKFLNAVETEQGLSEQIQNIQKLLTISYLIKKRINLKNA